MLKFDHFLVEPAIQKRLPRKTKSSQKSNAQLVNQLSCSGNAVFEH